MQKLNKQKTQNIFPGLIRKKPTSFEQAFISKYPAMMQAKFMDKNSFQNIVKISPSYSKVKESVINWNQFNHLQEEQKILNLFDLKNQNKMFTNPEINPNFDSKKMMQEIKDPKNAKRLKSKETIYRNVNENENIPDRKSIEKNEKIGKKLNNKKIDPDLNQRESDNPKNIIINRKIQNYESEKGDKMKEGQLNNEIKIKPILDIQSSRPRSLDQNLKAQNLLNTKPIQFNIQPTNQDTIPDKKTLENVPTENLILKKNNSRLIIKGGQPMNINNYKTLSSMKNMKNQARIDTPHTFSFELVDKNKQEVKKEANLSNLVSYLPPSKESKQLLKTIDSEVATQPNVSNNLNVKYSQREPQRIPTPEFDLQSSPIVKNFSLENENKVELPQFENPREGLQNLGQIPKTSYQKAFNKKDSKTLSSIVNKKNTKQNIKLDNMKLMPSLMKNAKQKRKYPNHQMTKNITEEDNSDRRIFTSQNNCFPGRAKANQNIKPFSQPAEIQDEISSNPFENKWNRRVLKKYFHFSLKKKQKMNLEGIKSLYREGKQRNIHDNCKSEKKMQFLHNDFAKFKSHKFMNPDNDRNEINFGAYNQIYDNDFNEDFQNLNNDFEYEFCRPNLISICPITN